MTLNSHRLHTRSSTFRYHLYESFHSHLPEELFFEDFMTAMNKACKVTYKVMAKAFERVDAIGGDGNEVEEGGEGEDGERIETPMMIIKEAIAKATLDEQYTPED
jgi:hypothetical protein